MKFSESLKSGVFMLVNSLLKSTNVDSYNWAICLNQHEFFFFSKEHSKEELDAWKLVRVSEDFRVIALGLPVPRYQGNPLDPPLRSRFQARDINPLSFNVS